MPSSFLQYIKYIGEATSIVSRYTNCVIVSTRNLYCAVLHYYRTHVLGKHSMHVVLVNRCIISLSINSLPRRNRITILESYTMYYLLLIADIVSSGSGCLGGCACVICFCLVIYIIAKLLPGYCHLNQLE